MNFYILSRFSYWSGPALKFCRSDAQSLSLTAFLEQELPLCLISLLVTKMHFLHSAVLISLLILQSNAAVPKQPGFILVEDQDTPRFTLKKDRGVPGFVLKHAQNIPSHPPLGEYDSPIEQVCGDIWINLFLDNKDSFSSCSQNLASAGSNWGESVQYEIDRAVVEAMNACVNVVGVR